MKQKAEKTKKAKDTEEQQRAVRKARLANESAWAIAQADARLRQQALDKQAKERVKQLMEEAALERQRQAELERKLRNKAKLEREQQSRETETEAMERVARLRNEFYSRPDVNVVSDDDLYFVYYLESVFLNKSPLILYQHHDVTTIPSVLGAFEFITEVNLSHNSLRMLPNLSALPNLRRLYLHHNALQVLPLLDHLVQLEVLDLHSNRLEALPDLSTLVHLQTLDCEKNVLRAIPDGIGLCTRLDHLNLRHNQIKIVTSDIGRLKKLSYLNLRNNPITNLPPHIYQRGMTATLEFLSAHTTDTTDTKENDVGSIRGDFARFYALSPSFLSDGVIQSEDGQSFPVHAAILHARSSYFSPILQDIKVGGGAPKFVIQVALSASYVKILLEYIYGDTFTPKKLEEVRIPAGALPEVISELQTINIKLKLSLREEYDKMATMAGKYGFPHLQYLIYRCMENKQITEHPESSFLASLAKLRKSCSFYDVKFAQHDAESFLHAHKMVLCARSVFLKNLLTGGMAESKSEIVSMPPDVPDSILQTVLEYCYTDDVQTFDPETVLDVLTTAMAWGVIGLQHLVESVVGFSLDVSNVCFILSLAWSHSMKKLARACKFFVLSNWTAVTSSEDWITVEVDVRNKLLETAKKWQIASVAL